jgi:hypothetical protein
MNTSIAAGSLLAALSLVAPLHGQVTAGVVVRSGPVAGHVVIGDGYSTYRRPVVVYRREPARVIVIERVQRRQFHDRRWRKHSRPVVVYYLDGRYYDRSVRGWPMREIVVYERDGRYYRECDDRDDDRYHGRSDDRRDRDYHEDRNWD